MWHNEFSLCEHFPALYLHLLVSTIMMANHHIFVLVIVASFVLPEVLSQATCNETSLDPNAYCACCDDGAICSYNNNRFICSCGIGFTGDDGFNCTDNDECALEALNNCDSKDLGGNCTNTPGSYNCSCASGYRSKSGNGRGCVDINECRENPNACDNTTSTCRNTPGDYECDCTNQFTQSEDKYLCIDVDECATNTSNCRYGCNNTLGGYTCVCFNGFTGDGNTCTDIDECDGSNPCDSKANCTNTEGSYTCQCEAGLTGNGSSCSEWNECKYNVDDCDEASTYCSDTPRSYECKCFLGYKRYNATHCTAASSQSAIEDDLADLKRQKLLVDIRGTQLEISRLEKEQARAILNCRNKEELIKHEHRGRRQALNVDDVSIPVLEQELTRLEIRLNNIQLRNRVIANRCNTV